MLAAVRYVAMNPVKAGLSKRPEQYRWSSAAAYLSGKDDPLIKVRHLNKVIDNWKEFFKEGVDNLIAERMLKHEHTGRPLGSEKFVLRLEKMLDIMLKPKKAGRPKKKEIN